jgi:regulator of sigma E protease
MNVMLAFVIFTGILWLASPVTTMSFDGVQPDSPAAAAGLKPGESIVAIDGTEYQLFRDGRIDDGLRASAGQTVSLTIASPDGSERDVTATLRDKSQINENRGALGIEDVVVHMDTSTTNDFGTALRTGAEHTARWMGLIVGGLASLVNSIATDPTAPPPVSGPIGIATQIGDVFFNAGPVLTLYVAGILSANLAVVNILPFPPLDGGRMLMITLKRLFGRRISVRAEQLTYLVGFVFLFAFIIWVSGFDLVRTLGGAPPPAP